MLKKCEDNYFTTFSSPVVMLDYHEQLERESKWHRCKVNTLQVEPLNESSPLYGNLSAFASGISQDAVEDTFIQCYNNINKLKNNGAFKVWFYRILTRNACKYAKKDNKNIPVEDENINAGSVNDEYFSSEKYIRLYNAIDSLNEKMKTTVVLFYFNEMSIKEIAKITGSFEGTVKTRLFAARKRLKKYLETDMEA